MWRRGLAVGAMTAACAGGAGTTAGGAGTTPVPPPPLVEPEPVEISAAVLHGLLIEGEVQLPHDDTGLPAGALRYQVCLDRAGAATVTPWPMAVPSYGELDRAVQARMATWRFRPLVRDDAPVAACAVVRIPVALPPPPVHVAASDALLPLAAVELPRPTILRMPRPAGVARPPTPGVGIVVRCARAAGGPPVAALVQASGDATADARALYAPMVRPVDDAAAAAAEPRCHAVAIIAGAPPPARVVPAVAPTWAPPQIVAPVAFDQRRVAGDKYIFPGDLVKDEIAASGRSLVTVPVKVCVDVTGRVDDVTILESSGFVAYDIELLNAIPSWRYQPFVLDAQAVPVCSIVQFMYRQVAPADALPLDGGDE